MWRVWLPVWALLLLTQVPGKRSELTSEMEDELNVKTEDNEEVVEEEVEVEHKLVFTSANFQSHLRKGKEEGALPLMVNIHAPWCNHCKRFLPNWEIFTDKAQHLIRAGTLDATEHKYVAERFGVSGYPSVVLINGDDLYTYNGNRKVEDLLYFAEGGYLEEDVREIKPPMNFWTSMLEDNAQNVREIILITNRKPLVAVSIFVCGSFVGAMLSAVVLVLSGYRTKRLQSELLRQQERYYLDSKRYYSKMDKFNGHAIMEPYNPRPVRTRPPKKDEKGGTGKVGPKGEKDTTCRNATNGGGDETMEVVRA